MCNMLSIKLAENDLHRHTDTLLNVFLAIAVDNLATAQELTAAEEKAAEEQEKAGCSTKIC
jgi:hypothetical protein